MRDPAYRPQPARHRLTDILHHGICQYCADCAERQDIEQLYVCLSCGLALCQACASLRSQKHPGPLRCTCGQPLARLAHWARPLAA